MRYKFTLLATLLIASQTHAAAFYGAILCKNEDYECHKVKKGETWERLFPNAEKRDIAMRVNRTNKQIWPGMTIAIPKNLESLTIYDVAPFPRFIDAPGRKTIFISQKDLAYGAYNASGELIWWGPVSSGRDWCSDVGEHCGTPVGEFLITRKQGIDCISSKFPIEWEGGAPMPFCMHFYGGFAIHGSYDVPGHRDSHGCVRTFIEDARWLNEEFVEVGNGKTATQVIIGPIS